MIHRSHRQTNFCHTFIQNFKLLWSNSKLSSRTNSVIGIAIFPLLHRRLTSAFPITVPLSSKGYFTCVLIFIWFSEETAFCLKRTGYYRIKWCPRLSHTVFHIATFSCECFISITYCLCFSVNS